MTTLKIPHCLLVVAALGAAPTAPAQDAPNPRGEMESLALALDDAVRRVSLPSAEPLLGSEVARGYYVAGVGAMFVVPPRSVPRIARVFVVRPGRGGARAPAPAPEAFDYAELEALLGAEEARRIVEQRRLEEQARREIARTARERRLQGTDRELHALEARAEAFQREAERARLEAERVLEDVMREVQTRLGVAVAPDEADPGVLVARPPARAAAPEAPVPEGASTAVAPPEAAVPGTPADAAAPGTPGPPPGGAPPGPQRVARPTFVPAPPWRFWFGTANPEDDRSPDRIVADVREAVTATLEAHGAGLRTIGPDELVSVAIDFVPRGLFSSAQRPARTLVVRVRKRALEERAAGRLAGQEFKRQVQVSEY